MRKSKVYIIESPSAEDVFNGRHEGAKLKANLEHAGIPTTLRTVIDVEHLQKAFVEVMLSHEPDSYPIVHFSMHGNENKQGVVFTSNETFTWEALGDDLCYVNAALGGMLLVTMSSCFGFGGTEMAHRDDGEPFFALVGPKEKVSWTDTVAAFTTFYHHVVARDGSIVPGVKLINDMLGTELFFAARGDEAKIEWQATKLAEERFRRAVESIMRNQRPGRSGSQ